MSFLVDTTLLSEIRRPSPDRGVVAWGEAVSPGEVFTSVLVLGELRQGIHRLEAAPQRRALEQWLDDEVYPWFGGRVLPVTVEVADRWGSLRGDSLRAGVTLPLIDSLIAATAVVHGLTVVTRNVRDFERCGVPIASPWTA